jgi:hypothetical protein
VTDIDDPTSAGAGIELIDLHAVQLGAVPFRARRVVVRLEGAVVVFHSTTARVRTRTTVSNGLVAYVAFAPHAKGTVNGLKIRPGMVLAAAPGTEANFVVDAAWESVTFLLPPQELSEHLRARRREAEFRLPRGAEPLEVSEEGGRGLFDWGKRLVALAARQPDLFNERWQERIAARVDLVETLLARSSQAARRPSEA